MNHTRTLTLVASLCLVPLVYAGDRRAFAQEVDNSAERSDDAEIAYLRAYFLEDGKSDAKAALVAYESLLKRSGLPDHVHVRASIGRARCLRALGRAEESAAVVAALSSSHPDHPEVAGWRATRRVGKAHHNVERAVEELLTGGDNIALVGEFGASAFPVLRRFMASPIPRYAMRAAEALVHMKGDAAYELLLEGCTGSAPRRAAIRTMARRAGRDPRFVELVMASRDEEWRAEFLVRQAGTPQSGDGSLRTPAAIQAVTRERGLRRTLFAAGNADMGGLGGLVVACLLSEDGAARSDAQRFVEQHVAPLLAGQTRDGPSKAGLAWWISTATAPGCAELSLDAFRTLHDAIWRPAARVWLNRMGRVEIPAALVSRLFAHAETRETGLRLFLARGKSWRQVPEGTVVAALRETGWPETEDDGGWLGSLTPLLGAESSESDISALVRVVPERYTSQLLGQPGIDADRWSASQWRAAIDAASPRARHDMHRSGLLRVASAAVDDAEWTVEVLVGLLAHPQSRWRRDVLSEIVRTAHVGKVSVHRFAARVREVVAGLDDKDVVSNLAQLAALESHGATAATAADLGVADVLRGSDPVVHTAIGQLGIAARIPLSDTVTRVLEMRSLSASGDAGAVHALLRHRPERFVSLLPELLRTPAGATGAVAALSRLWTPEGPVSAERVVDVTESAVRTVEHPRTLRHALTELVKRLRERGDMRARIAAALLRTEHVPFLALGGDAGSRARGRGTPRAAGDSHLAPSRRDSSTGARRHPRRAFEPRGTRRHPLRGLGRRGASRDGTAPVEHRAARPHGGRRSPRRVGRDGRRRAPPRDREVGPRRCRRGRGAARAHRPRRPVAIAAGPAASQPGRATPCRSCGTPPRPSATPPRRGGRGGTSRTSPCRRDPC